jgi:hypothetical protein
MNAKLLNQVMLFAQNGTFQGRPQADGTAHGGAWQASMPMPQLLAAVSQQFAATAPLQSPPPAHDGQRPSMLEMVSDL